MPRIKKPTQAKAQKIKPLTPQRIMEIHEKMGKGLIHLPKILPNHRWGLLDSGSAPHVANHKRHFPGAKRGKMPAAIARMHSRQRLAHPLVMMEHS